MNKISETSVRALGDTELSLIKGYVKKYNNQNYWNGRKVEYVTNNYDFSFLGSSNTYNNGGKKSKKNNQKSDYGLPVAITVLAVTVAYFFITIPRLYNYAKEYYYTRTIKQIAAKRPINIREKIIIRNLNYLLEADRSSDFLKNQASKTIATSSLIISSATYIASYSYKNIAKGALDYANSIVPTSVANFAGKCMPELIKPSEQTVSKVIKLLSDDNLIFFAKATAAASVGLFVLNGAHSLYKDFFYDTKYTDLDDVAKETSRLVDELKNGPSVFSSAFSLQNIA